LAAFALFAAAERVPEYPKSVIAPFCQGVYIILLLKENCREEK